jgi:hypothetical protein
MATSTRWIRTTCSAWRGLAARRCEPPHRRRLAGGIEPHQSQDLCHADAFGHVLSAADCQAEWRLIPDAEFRPIQTIDWHLALFGTDPNALTQLDKHLSELLATKI